MYTYKLKNNDNSGYIDFNINYDRSDILTIYTKEQLDLDNINEKLESSDKIIKKMTLVYLENMSVNKVFAINRRYKKVKLILDV